MAQQQKWTFLSVGFEKLHQAWHSSCTEAAPKKSRNTKIITEHLVQQVEHLLVRDAFIMAGCHARPCHACIYDPLIQDFKILEKCDSLRVTFFYTTTHYSFVMIQATQKSLTMWCHSAIFGGWERCCTAGATSRIRRIFFPSDIFTLYVW